MSRYDYADPGTDSEYCDALTSEAEAEPPDHSLADVSRVDRIIARLRGEEWYTYRDTSNMVWIWDGLQMWYAGPGSFTDRVPSAVFLSGVIENERFTRVGP